MARFHIVTDASTSPPTTSQVPYTTQEEAAADVAEAVSQIEASRQATFASDATRADILNRLRTATAAQVRTFVTNQVTDLASARTMLANILILIALDTRQ